ncbi:MAG: N-acetylmuramoyl-L-alanine amidase family protein [Firmicutes bacterium]|nr:N-acetylmuramoyl-L-alanine amidase family protein [Bacillota bacterium]
MRQPILKNQNDQIKDPGKWLGRIISLTVFLFMIWAQPVRAAEVKPLQLFWGGVPVDGQAGAALRDGARFVNLPFLNQYLQIISQWDPDTGKLELKFGRLNLTLNENQPKFYWNDETKKLTNPPFTADGQLWIPVELLLELGLSLTLETETRIQLDWRDNYLLKVENTTYQNRPAFLVVTSKSAVLKNDNLLINPDRLMVDLNELKIHPAFEQITSSAPAVRNVRAAQYNPDTVRLVFDLNQLAGYKIVQSPAQPQKLLIVLNCFVTGIEFIKTEAVRMVRITTSLPTQYRTFFLKDPHRMVVDLEGTTLRAPHRQISGDGSWVRSVRLGQLDPQTVRVVLDLGGQTPCYVEPSPEEPGVIEIRTIQKIIRVDWLESGRLQITGDSGLNEAIRRINQECLQIDLNFFQFNQDLKTPRLQNALVTGIRFITLSPTLARIEVDFPKYTIYQYTLSPNHRQLTIDFSRSPILGRTIVLDAGHGGFDPGTCGSQGTLEKEIVLDITLRLKNLLEEAGAGVALTRSDDRYISLFERPWLANFIMADLFISIHCNSYVRDRGIRGTELFYFQGRPGAKELAGQVLEKLTKFTGLANRGLRPNNFAVLSGAQMPGLLVETGYLSNYEEESLLNEETFRARIALGIFQGLIAFYTN